MIDLKDFKQVYDYKQFQKHMRSKLKRIGKDRTFTPVDYFSKEEIEEFNKKGINNLEPYLPIPDDVREHDCFVEKTRDSLVEKYPDDEFLRALHNEENLELFFSYSWYEKYGISYHG